MLQNTITRSGRLIVPLSITVQEPEFSASPSALGPESDDAARQGLPPGIQNQWEKSR